jgi:hypothetical protein
MVVEKEKSQWKKQFRKEIKKQPPPKRDALDILKDTLYYPPLQNVFDMPPFQEGMSTEDEQPVAINQPSITTTKSASSSDKSTIKNTLDRVGATLKSIRSAPSEYFYELCVSYVEWCASTKLVGDGTLSGKETKRDATIVKTFFIALLFILPCSYVAYNWYYLLFYEGTKAIPVDFDTSTLFSNSIFRFFFEFVSFPLKLLDGFLFDVIPKQWDKDKNLAPLQSVNFLILFVFILLMFVNYVEGNQQNVGILVVLFLYSFVILKALSFESSLWIWLAIFSLIPLVAVFANISNAINNVSMDISYIFLGLIVFAWGKWGIEYLKNLSPASFSFVGIISNLLYILIRLIFSISFSSFAVYFVEIYLVIYSFFGMMVFDNASFTNLYWRGGLDNFIMRKDSEFYDRTAKHGFIGMLRTITDKMYGRTYWVGLLLLCLIYLIAIPAGVSNYNVKWITEMGIFAIFLFVFLGLWMSKKTDNIAKYDDIQAGTGMANPPQVPMANPPQVPMANPPQVPMANPPQVPIANPPQVPMANPPQVPSMNALSSKDIFNKIATV